MSALRPLRLALAAALLAAPGSAAGPEALAVRVPRPSAQRNGLLQQIVYCLERDRLGRVWAGTRNGPFVYDGRRWTQVPLPAGAESLYVRAIQHTADGSLWFGTQEGGIWRLHEGAWTRFGRAEGLPDERINSLAEAPDEAGRPCLWAGTTAGAARFDGRAWHPEGTAQGLPGPWVWRLRVLPFPDGRPHLWAATQSGLAHREGGRWLPWTDGLPGREVNDLLAVEEAPGRSVLWASFWNLGPGRWDGRAWTVHGPERGFPGTFPATLAQAAGDDGRPTVWVGSYDSGLAHAASAPGSADARWHTLGISRGLPSEGVFSLLADPGGGHPFLWVGTRGGGVTTLGLGGGARLLDAQAGLPAGEVKALLQERDGTFWFATTRGLARFRDGAWTVYRSAQGLPSEAVTALAQGPDGTLWAGTASGVARKAPGAPGFTPLPGMALPVSALAPEGGRLWAGTPSGLRLWSGGWSAPAEGPGAAEVLSLAAVPEAGELWAGTKGHGLWQRKAGRWIRHDPNPNFRSSQFGCLQVERGPGKLRLWAGTQGNGLVRLDLLALDPAWDRFSSRSPIPLADNMVRAMAWDLQGRLCVGTALGVSRLSFDAAGALASVELLGEAEGAPAHFCSLGAALTAADGRVWFGFPEGALVMDPEPEAAAAPLPPPALAQVLVQGRPASLAPGSRLSHRENRLAFEFFLPWFHREEDVQFRSQLVGLEPAPGPWGGENRREFSALGPGRYALKVWARDHEGRVSGPLELPFRIAPAPWLHPLALAAYALLAGGGVLAWVRLRTHLLRERNRELEAAVAEATDELRRANQGLHHLNEEKNRFLGTAAHDLKNPLNGILLMMEVLDGEALPADVLEIHGKVRRAAREMVDLIARLLDVNAIDAGHRGFRLEPVDLGDLVARAVERFAPLAEAKGQSLEVEVDAPAPKALADEATLFEALGNLVSNALKFTPPGPPARPVRIRARRADGAAVLEVADQGPGFTEEDKAKAFTRFARLSARPTGGEHSTGLGLSIVRQQVESMGGRVELESEPGHGATLRIVLPEG